MRILCLSAYDAASHRRWHEGLVKHLGDHEFTVLSLPPRHFRWRIRGNSIFWARERRDVLEQDWDTVIATSMVDLSALRGFVPKLADALNVVYFHENQFAYPVSEHQRDDGGPAVVNLYAALCADRVAFNSRYNRDSFIDGARDFLNGMPDFVPADVPRDLGERSRVVPVPLASSCFSDPELATPNMESTDTPLSIVWNHRWEYDKAPRRFFRALEQVSKRGLDFELHVLGQRFRTHPAIFDRAKDSLAEHIATFGYVDDVQAYRDIVRRADLVVSTALHEFQGLAMLEAIAMGCRPLAPDRLAYPEYVPEMWRYASYPDDEGREVGILAERIAELCEDAHSMRKSAPVDVSGYSWQVLTEAYRQLLTA
jgi:glycosyltransferase involved in cell wall biosynthesis